MEKEEIEKLRETAETYRYLYRSGQCSREVAKENITPYLNAVNEKMKEIAKKYNRRPQKIGFAIYIR